MNNQFKRLGIRPLSPSTSRDVLAARLSDMGASEKPARVHQPSPLISDESSRRAYRAAVAAHALQLTGKSFLEHVTREARLSAEIVLSLGFRVPGFQ